ncbi:MAG: LON peptidase substrate-binding domain-containing protein [Rhizobiaceae bacterium]|nr:LON peptidase substrate-binding domain-containing protein [Rhizobiaceae bacterium]
MQAGNVSYHNADDFPEILPIFPLTGALLLPGGHLPLNIFEPRYLQMVGDAMQNHKLIGMIQPNPKGQPDENGQQALSQIGCIGRITACQESGDGRLLISLSGVCRFTLLEEVKTTKLYRLVQYQANISDLDQATDLNDVDREGVLTAFRNYLQANGMEADWETVEKTETDTLITALCMMSPFEPAEKQALLESPNLKTRAETLIAISEFYLARNSGEPVSSLQ